MAKEIGTIYIIGVATLVTDQCVINAWKVTTGNAEIVARYDVTDPKQVEAAGIWAMDHNAYWAGHRSTFDYQRRVESVAEVVRTFS